MLLRHLVRHLTHVARQAQRRAFGLVEQVARLELPDLLDALVGHATHHAGMRGVRLAEAAAVGAGGDVAHEHLHLDRDTLQLAEGLRERHVPVEQSGQARHREERVRHVTGVVVKVAEVVLELGEIATVTRINVRHLLAPFACGSPPL